VEKEIVEHKYDCSEIRKKERHDFVKDIISPRCMVMDSKVEKNEDMINKVDKKTQLFTQITKRMEKDIQEIKDTLKEFIIAADKKYATKESVNRIDKLLWWFWTAIVMWMWGFIWQLIIDVIWN